MVFLVCVNLVRWDCVCISAHHWREITCIVGPIKQQKQKQKQNKQTKKKKKTEKKPNRQHSLFDVFTNNEFNNIC